jgi:hypothetical protein
MTQELTSPSINNNMALKKLWGLFPFTHEIFLPCELVEEFAILKNGKLINIKSSKHEFLIALICRKHQFYYILSSGGEVYQWGIRPDNYIFGLDKALELAVFQSPVNRPNVLLCDNLHDSLVFLFNGIPALLVDPQTVWIDPYFTQIVRPLFSNIIITYKSFMPKEALPQQGIKYFDLEDYIKGSQRDSLIQHLLMDGLDEGALEPLFELYEYIDDDRLLYENNTQGQFSIKY